MFLSTDGRYGGESNVSGVFEGLIGDVQGGVADISVSDVTENYSRNKVVDFSTPFFHDVDGILTLEPKSERAEPTIVFDVLQPKVSVSGVNGKVSREENPASSKMKKRWGTLEIRKKFYLDLVSTWHLSIRHLASTSGLRWIQRRSRCHFLGHSFANSQPGTYHTIWETFWKHSLWMLASWSVYHRLWVDVYLCFSKLKFYFYYSSVQGDDGLVYFRGTYWKTDRFGCEPDISYQTWRIPTSIIRWWFCIETITGQNDISTCRMTLRRTKLWYYSYFLDLKQWRIEALERTRVRRWHTQSGSRWKFENGKV